MTIHEHRYTIHLYYVPTRLLEVLRCGGCTKKRKRNVNRCPCSVRVAAPYKPDPDCSTCAGSGFVPLALKLCPCAKRPWRKRCVNCQAANACSAMHVCRIQTPEEQERADDLASVVAHKSAPSEAARKRAGALEL